MRKLLRLIVACTIHHPESYYQISLKSKGIDYQNLSLNQISVWVSTCKIIEADLLIESAFTLNKTKLKEVDIELFMFWNIKDNEKSL
jgi:hypothetical protein